MKAKTLGARLEAFHRTLAVAAGLVVVLILVVMLYEVVMRYLLSKPSQWEVDFLEMMMWPLTYLAAAYITQQEGHVRVTVVIDRLSQKMQRRLHLISNVLALCYAFLLFWQSWVSTLNMKEANILTGSAYLPMWQLSGIVGIGALFLCLQLIINITKDVALLGSTEGKEVAIPAPEFGGI